MAAKVEISKRLLLVNSASNIGTRIISATVLIWLNQYLLRRIAPEEYALYPVVSAVMVFFPLMTCVLTAGIGRYAIAAYAQGDARRVTQIVSTMFPLTLAAGVLVMALGGVFTWYIDHILTIAPGRVWEARAMMAMNIFAFAVSVSLVPLGSGFHIRQKFLLLNSLDLSREVLRLILLFVLIFGLGTRVLWVVAATASANLVYTLVSRMVSRRLVPALRFQFSEIRWNMVRELTSYGGWSLLGLLADNIRRASDPLVLNKLTTSVAVNAFSVGNMPNTLTLDVSSRLLAPFMPQLTAMYATGDRDRLRNTFLRGGRYALWASLFVSAPLMVFCQEVIQVYLKERATMYAAAAPVMLLLLASLPFGYGVVMLSNLAIASAKIRPWTTRLVGLQLFNLGLTIYLVGWLKMGAVGSALGTFVTHALGWPLLVWPLAMRLTGISFGRWLRETLGPGLAPALAALPLWLLLKYMVHPASWLGLGLCAAAGLAVYTVVLFVFCMQPADRADLRAAKDFLSRLGR